LDFSSGNRANNVGKQSGRQYRFAITFAGDRNINFDGELKIRADKLRAVARNNYSKSRQDRKGSSPRGHGSLSGTDRFGQRVTLAAELHHMSPVTEGF
jgi:hypothetical protein